MKPYYQDDWVTIYHGDSRDIIPILLDRVDAVLTDPPYGVSEGVGSGLRKNRLIKSSYLSYDDTVENYEKTVVPVIKRCVIDYKRVVLTPGIKNMYRLPKPDHTGSFQYGKGTTVMSCWGPVLWQPIFYYGKDPYQGHLVPDSIQGLNDHAEDNGHPCPKPLKQWKKLLLRMSKEGESILDPFMGSGTTLRLCKDSGRKSIGIEIEEKYCEIAVRMMRQEVLI
jgi:site-specific DNA-methyltransferase (adenine-specific)